MSDVASISAYFGFSYILKAITCIYNARRMNLANDYGKDSFVLFSSTNSNQTLADEITYLWAFACIEIVGVLLIPVLWRGLKTKSFHKVACWMIFEVTSLTFQLFFCYVVIVALEKFKHSNLPEAFFKSFIKIIVAVSIIVEMAMFVVVIYVVKNFEYFANIDHQQKPSALAVIVLPDAPPAYNESLNGSREQDKQPRHGGLTNIGFVI